MKSGSEQLRGLGAAVLRQKMVDLTTISVQTVSVVQGNRLGQAKKRRAKTDKRKGGTGEEKIKARRKRRKKRAVASIALVLHNDELRSYTNRPWCRILNVIRYFFRASGILSRSFRCAKCAGGLRKCFRSDQCLHPAVYNPIFPYIPHSRSGYL